MTNATQQGLATLARAASVSAQTLSALKQSIDNVLDSNTDTLPHDQGMITDKQKDFLTRLFKLNIIDKGEMNNKLEEMLSYSRDDADQAIKQFLGR